MTPLPRQLGGLLPVLTVALGLCGAALLGGPGCAAEKTKDPASRVVPVTPPQARGAVEVSVAINPANPDHLIGASIARLPDHPGITDFAYVSKDAGRSWRMVPRANPHAVQQGDDVVTFTPDGLAVHAFIAFAGIRQTRPRRAHSGIVTSTSRNGITWSEQVPVIELFNSVEPHEDKPWIRADLSSDSPHRGNLYVTWTRFDVYGSKKPEHKSHVYFSCSRDSGKSYSVPRKISDQPGDAQDKSDTLMGACPGVGPKGEVYVVWAGPQSIFFTRSTDAGLNFGKNKIISDCAGWDYPIKGLGRASGCPSVGVDLTRGKDRGSIYVCWGDARNGDPDVFLVVSRDGGETWSKPLRVNQDDKGKEQWFPWLVVDPVDGSVNIAYYDRGAREGTLTDVTLTRSVDGGRTFAHFKLNEQTYDLNKLGFFGDYLGLDCRGGRVVALWMHPMAEPRRLGISSTVLDFEPGTLEPRAQKTVQVAEAKVAPIPADVIKRYKLDTDFYKKHVDYKGFSILGSAKVSDAALLEARYLIDELLGARADILMAMIQAGCRFMVMAPTEMTTDVPEQRDWNKAYWDRRARGMGGKLSSCGEENLLNLRGDRYNRENILIHEFNHAVHQQGLRSVDPTFDGRLRDTYKKAMAKGLWKSTYLATNASEYWAEGVQAYFDCMRAQYGANTREKLQKYDPDLFALVDEVYKQSKFRYVRYDRRHPPLARKDEAPAHDAAPPPGSTGVEQTHQGAGGLPELVASFDGLGVGFQGPQGTAALRNPSDNSLAVGPDHIVQTVNTRMAIFTKKGKKYDATGKVLYGPVNTANVFKDFGDFGDLNFGDAVVRYDQLADRWLIVLPVFRRLPFKKNAPPGKAGAPAQVSLPGVDGQPGPAQVLYQPPAAEKVEARRRGPRLTEKEGSYAMCYAVSTGPDPLGPYYRYVFERPLFPDYPRPAVWPDGYYVTTSTSDFLTQRHVYVVERDKMLRGEPATEQGFVLDGVNFLIPADLDGKELPPPGAPNVLLATGGTQLQHIVKDDGIYAWKHHVDWKDPSRSKLEGPVKIPVAPYEYLGGGQLTRTVPQPGTTQRLDVQGDKLMARLVYRHIGDREVIVGAHSVKTAAGGGGIRWYEFRLDDHRNVRLYQQGTFAPDGLYRWMPSPAIDGQGNLGIGYSFGGPLHFPGQRFTGRLAQDPPGQLTLRELVLVGGEAAQTNAYRWQDYTQTALDPSDDRTIWYVGDYLKKGETRYSTRIAAIRLPDSHSAK
jgi:hypothetical protein